MSGIRGQVMRQGIEVYLDEIDHKTADGQRVELLQFDDENNGDLAAEKALEIATHPNAPLVVLGHRSSAASMRGGEVYKQYQVPAITGSAPATSTTKDNDWYFRVIIENESQGHFVTEYVSQVMGYKSISVIYASSEYGSTLGQAILNHAGDLSTVVQYEGSYDTSLSSEEIVPALQTMVDEILALEDPGIVVLAVHDEQGAELVKMFHDGDPQLPILETLITQTFYNHLEDITGGNSATYLEGVYTTQHIIFDTGNKQAQDFQAQYENKYGEAPDAAAAAYYDAAMLAIKAINETGADGTNATQDRGKIRDYLASQTRLNPDLVGATGYLYFDADGDAIKPVPIGFYDNGKLISAPVQLQSVPNVELVRDLDVELRSGNVLNIDGNYLYKTQVIYTGIDLIEVSDLDMKNSTFGADFYLWFRHEGDFDVDEIEFINAVNPINLENLIASDVYDGVTYRVYRVTADFKSVFDFRAYPFDKQTLNIRFRDRTSTKEQLIFVLDGLRLLPRAAQVKDLSEAGVDGWIPIDVVVYSDIIRSDSTLGNPRLSSAGIEYSVFNVDTFIRRDALSFSIKNLFPIFAVLVLSYLAFFMPADQFGLRVSLGINAIMTTAFFSLRISSDLPPIGYLVALEYIFFMTYTLAIFVIIVSIFTFVASKNENDSLIKRLNWLGRIVHPLTILVTGLIIAFILVI
jgi:branched-chain amino acid transport system substrate-binding protein